MLPAASTCILSAVRDSSASLGWRRLRLPAEPLHASSLSAPCKLHIHHFIRRWSTSKWANYGCSCYVCIHTQCTVTTWKDSMCFYDSKYEDRILLPGWVFWDWIDVYTLPCRSSSSTRVAGWKEAAAGWVVAALAGTWRRR